jgi:putative membrane protein
VAPRGTTPPDDE